MVFQLRDPETLIFRLKYIANHDPFKEIEKISRFEYQIHKNRLQEIVSICDKYRWEVIPFPDTVQKALEYDIRMSFDKAFKDTHLWDCMFDYQKEGVEHIVTTFNGRALIGDEMGLGKTLQAIPSTNTIRRRNCW